jgi:ankyrin repeat protein
VNGGCYANPYSGLLHIAFYCKQPEIARMLISNGADPEHISSHGTTPLFHLFQPDQKPTMTSTAELIEMLTPHSLSGINTQSCKGWTPLHRAAAYGTGQDVENMVKRGANLTLKTSYEKWLPIFVAVNFNNIDTFKQLASYSPKSCIEDVDVRGWTMLHIAAALGSSELVEHLIRLGADPYALSRSGSEWSNDLIPENMQGRQLTPAGVAKFSGEDEYRKCVYGLRSAGVEFDDCSNSEEIFLATES